VVSEPVTRTVNQAVHDRLREHILAGGVSSGARLDERLLSQQLGVSRTPVRDAIGKLASEGIVDYRPHQGAFVRELTVKEVNDLYIVRISLETLAARLAIQNVTDSDVEMIRETIEASEQALAAGDLAEFGRHDHRMHALIVELSDNAALRATLDRVDSLIQIARNLANQVPGFAQETDHQRLELLGAFERRDEAAAVDALRIHIESVQRTLVSQLESRLTPSLTPVASIR
jgi:DNA-binding GntR family transcriptional regulator